jgi:hypothetical protein
LDFIDFKLPQEIPAGCFEKGDPSVRQSEL